MAKIYKALDIANYFLFKAEKDEELISNLKVQKLIYYAQGIHLALFGKPIFEDPIKAWTYGPVVPSLYGRYKKYGTGNVPPDPAFDPETIDSKTRGFLDEIYMAFGQFSAGRLIDFTHSDQCWEDAHPNKVISHKAMQESLKKYLRNGKK